MAKHKLEEIARSLLAEGKGILAADETVATITKRFAAHGIASTPDSRRDYRHMLVTTPELSKHISGVILYDETFHQDDPRGESLVRVIELAGMLPGIKVDLGAKPLAACPGETITEGLDGLRDRLREYEALGARFAKWRAVIRIGEGVPSETCLEANAHALARYAALCQERGLVPIVEPEVLMDGPHRLARTEEVTGRVLDHVFLALRDQRVLLEGMLLKPNMVVPGEDSQDLASVAAVARVTLRVLRRHVPAAVPGIVFLSGGQDERSATAHLQTMHASPEHLPWAISFSYGRALQDPALAAWGGKPANIGLGQQALLHRARCNQAAARGRYDVTMERTSAPAPVHRFADD